MVATKTRKRESKPDKEAGYVIIETKVEVPPAVRHPTPTHRLCAGASLNPCEACGAKWDIKAREEIDGKIIPAEHRTFAVEDVQIPVLTEYESVTGYRWMDIWPIWPIVIRHWLCPECYVAIEAYGMDQWCAERRAERMDQETEFLQPLPQREFGGWEEWREEQQRNVSYTALAMDELRHLKRTQNSEWEDSRLEPEDEASLLREIARFSGS